VIISNGWEKDLYYTDSLIWAHVILILRNIFYIDKYELMKVNEGDLE
jgi:hypothetical protein